MAGVIKEVVPLLPPPHPTQILWTALYFKATHFILQGISCRLFIGDVVLEYTETLSERCCA